jgi:hypothetical protein
MLIAVKNRFSFHCLSICDNSVQQLFIRIGDKFLVIGAVYIPPDSDINVYDIHFNTVDVKYKLYCKHF